MTSTYVVITQQQVEDVLIPRGFSKLSLAGVREVVYGKRVDDGYNQLSLRVYSSIEEAGGVSRECGKDAMRVCLMWRHRHHDQMLATVIAVGSSKRVNRVQGWEDRLVERINNWGELQGPLCSSCKAPMVTRKGKRGKFWGCGRYPSCKNTEEL